MGEMGGVRGPESQGVEGGARFGLGAFLCFLSFQFFSDGLTGPSHRRLGCESESFLSASRALLRRWLQ